MNRWMRTSFMACIVLGLVGGVAACGSKESSSKDESSKSDKKDKKDKKDKDDDEKDAKKSDKKDDKKDAKKDDKKVDLQALLAKNGGKEQQGMLKVKLPDDKGDVPLIGGDPPPAKHPDQPTPNEPPPSTDEPAQPAQAGVDWFQNGDVMVPNIGWKKSDTPPVSLLTSADQKAYLIFIPFGTEEEAEQIMKATLEGMNAAELQFENEPTEVKLGPNQLPAFVGTGHGKIAAQGIPSKMLFAEVKTGKPKNLLVIGVAIDGAPESDLDEAENMITSIKLAN